MTGKIVFKEQEIPFEEKPRLRLEYKGWPLKQEYEPDIQCFGEIILEIKAVNQPLSRVSRVS